MFLGLESRLGPTWESLDLIFCESSPLVGLRTLGSSPHHWLPRLLLQWGSLLVPPQGREADERSNKVPHLYSLGANVFFSGLLSEPKGKIITIYCITTIIWTFEGSTQKGQKYLR